MSFWNRNKTQSNQSQSQPEVSEDDIVKGAHAEFMRQFEASGQPFFAFDGGQIDAEVNGEKITVYVSSDGVVERVTR